MSFTDKIIARTLRAKKQTVRSFAMFRHKKVYNGNAICETKQIFSSSKTSAGRVWFYGFMNRHKNISVRKPEILSLARAAGMNIPVVQSWFNAYEYLVYELNIADKPEFF